MEVKFHGITPADEWMYECYNSVNLYMYRLIVQKRLGIFHQTERDYKTLPLNLKKKPEWNFNDNNLAILCFIIAITIIFVSFYL